MKDSIGGNCRTVMISNVSPSSLTFDDTYNTLKYADRAKRIKVRLRKNVVSVDFHVGQYAKIVDGMKREIDEWKAKANALAEENGRLKEEVCFETAIIRVRLFNVGLHFFAAKVAFSCPSVDRLGKHFWGLMTLDQVKSVPNFC